jgi:hypothetical protein
VGGLGLFFLRVGGYGCEEREREEERTCGACSRIVGVFLVLLFFSRGAILQRGDKDRMGWDT